MRDAGQHHGAVLFQLGQLLRHAVKADIDLADFAGHGLFVEAAGGKVAIAHPVGGVGQLLEWAVDQSGNHGGAGQQCMELYFDIARRMEAGAELAAAVDAALDAFIAENGKVIPGFGHRFHPIDPRSVKLIPMVEEAAKAGVIDGKFAAIGRQVEATLEARKGKRIPMNIDGATAVIYAELGFAAELGRGLFILSRSVGILAHAWEQSQQGGRIKGPMPPAIPYTYNGPAKRDVPGNT